MSQIRGLSVMFLGSLLEKVQNVLVHRTAPRCSTYSTHSHL